MKIFWFLLVFCFYGCTISLDGPEQPVKYVDLEKFMGKWYVIAFTPTFVDKGAENGIETYRLGEDGNIEIEYTFSIDGEFESHLQTGIVQPEPSNAKRRLKYNWLLSFDYHLSGSRQNLAANYYSTPILRCLVRVEQFLFEDCFQILHR